LKEILSFGILSDQFGCFSLNGSNTELF